MMASDITILVGSTGSGKSCLGNFLLDPETIWDDKVAFDVARDNKPCTQAPKSATSAYIDFLPTVRDPQPPDTADSRSQSCSDSFSFTILDTPGLNENPKADKDHMLEVAKQVASHRSIKACILVAKFDSKIDDQYVRTVAYYRRLFPKMFDNNLLIVLTNFQQDERSIKFRKRQGIDVEAVKANFRETVVSEGVSHYQPPIFVIDSLPMLAEEITINCSERLAILKYIATECVRIDTSELRFAKTDYMKQKDAEKAANWRGVLDGYRVELSQHESSDDYKQQMQNLVTISGKIVEQKSNLDKVESDVQNLESSDIVLDQCHDFSESWKILRWAKKKETIKCSFPNFIAERYPNDATVKWKAFEKDYRKQEVRVEMESRFMRGLHAHVKISGEKRLVYKKELREKKMERYILKNEISELKDKKESMQCAHDESLQKMQKKISDTENIILDYLSDQMSFDQAAVWKED